MDEKYRTFLGRCEMPHIRVYEGYLILLKWYPNNKAFIKVFKNTDTRASKFLIGYSRQVELAGRFSDTWTQILIDNRVIF
jgi:hypothetical protein